MPSHRSPGVYVEEAPSAVQPITGASTSIAAFIGAMPTTGITLGQPIKVNNVRVGIGDGTTTKFTVSPNPVTIGAVKVNGTAPDSTKVTLSVAPTAPATVTFTTAPAAGQIITVDYSQSIFIPADSIDSNKVSEAQLCTSFDDFTRAFGDFADPDKNKGQWLLAHAVYGFFNNGGSRCYVVRTDENSLTATTVTAALEKLAAVDEIAIVAAPGPIDKTISDSLIAHCSVQTGNRVAILDGPTGQSPDTALSDAQALASNSDYAALYYPWIKVFDPVTKYKQPTSDGSCTVPPSGHIAGIYARVDETRGVHKAPANEAVFGALGLETLVSKAQQEGLNPNGINCIRNLNGNILVWGARTWGGDDNDEYKYINVRRLMIYLERSIHKGLQWVVFEPDTPALWAKIIRNVSAFLTDVWRSGALFGASAKEAFYVRCDAALNPESMRSAGKVIIEIGVAPARPAEFVIFRLSQQTAPSPS